jgi:hypothetical protein
MVTLQDEMSYRFRMRGPRASTDGDWNVVGTDRFGRPDVRVQSLTEDGAVILLLYSGLVERTNTFKSAAEAGTPTGVGVSTTTREFS